MLPDLRFLRPEAREAFTEIGVGGSLRDREMAGFGGFFGAAGAEAIGLYLADRAHAVGADDAQDVPENEAF